MNHLQQGGPYQTALVVDDDPFSLDVAQLALERLGLPAIATAADGQAGIRTYDRMQPKPDLVVCDLFMPDMDGIEFINSLGERHYAGALVLVTGGDLSMMQMATQLAQSSYGLKVLGAWPKPLLAETLAAALGLQLPACESLSGAA
ncbi:MAG: response regulator [Rhodoferax sp.]|nr:response regulator [Rhodoferax sp.]